MKLLHITAHLGGGVGKAVSGLCLELERAGCESLVLLLEPPAQDRAFQSCRTGHTWAEVWAGSAQSLAFYLRWADIVVINWWEHPAMQAFLADFPSIPCRLILWSHINGCHYPYLSFELAARFDYILLTSPYSLENPYWQPAQLEWIRAHSDVVYGIGGFDPLAAPHKQTYQRSQPLWIGYAGTVNYSKLHRQFAQACREIHQRIPNTRFCILGEPDPQVLNDFSVAGLSNVSSFPGYVTDLPRQLVEVDIFGYPLVEENYATSENALLEALAAGLPVVTLRNGPERYILRDGETGFLADGMQDYVERMVSLCQNPALCERLGRAARSNVIERYSASRNAAGFLDCCTALLTKEPHTHSFAPLLGHTPWTWFLSALGPWQPRFAAWDGDPDAGRVLCAACPAVLREKRKSSIRHFAETFPEDEKLRILRTLLLERKE